MPKHVIAFALALVVGLGLVHGAGISTAYAHENSYPCGTVSGAVHCYGKVDWPGTNSGSGTTISIEQQPSGGNGFLNNELWEESDNNSGCSNYSDVCWIEGGYAVGATSTGHMMYFWADNRPGLGYRLFDLADVGPYDNSVNVQSSQDKSNDRWEIDLFNNDVSYTPSSSPNNMTGTRMTVGQELAGSSGASSPVEHYTGNLYVDAHTGVFHYQSLNGVLAQWRPPYAAWAVPPSQSSTGGDLKAWCC